MKVRRKLRSVVESERERIPCICGRLHDHSFKGRDVGYNSFMTGSLETEYYRLYFFLFF